MCGSGGLGPLTLGKLRDNVDEDRSRLQSVAESWNTKVGDLASSTGARAQDFGIQTDRNGNITNRDALQTQADALRESDHAHLRSAGQGLAEMLEADRLLDEAEAEESNVLAQAEKIDITNDSRVYVDGADISWVRSDSTSESISVEALSRSNETTMRHLDEAEQLYPPAVTSGGSPY